MSQAAFKLAVTKPCQQAWSSMTIAENGRHCSSCDKIVTDFSILGDDEIQNYFLSNSSKPVCGRFKASQLNRIKIHIPFYVFRKPIPFWKKFLLLFLICFGTQLYPLDIIVGNDTGLYAQTSTVKSNTGKQKKNHKKKKYTSLTMVKLVFDLPLEKFIMGGIGMIPEPATTPQAIVCIKKEMSASTDSALNKTASLSRTNKRQSKKSQDNTPPIEKTAFVLPATFKYRRKKKTQSK